MTVGKNLLDLIALSTIFSQFQSVRNDWVLLILSYKAVYRHVLVLLFR